MREDEQELSTDGRLTVSHDDGTARAPSTATGPRTTAPETVGAPLSATAFDDDTGTLWAGTYRGTGTPSHLTVAVAGRTVEASLLVLSSRPGWIAYYADFPDVPNVPDAQDTDLLPVITARSADGTTMATLREATSPTVGTLTE
ncbi:hypothetical protein MUU72_25535 [Streptomyces sp. RS10V-4]|uniref:hypothetical protein n=1 Tax=Streptomyces rhizoryzae TaxID=2932493 RepID=UPI002004DC47|nr:hypothetical protein [Streptomyces rhizoryzae]MCK7626426.1 hypothetical protein [Streptomyces rhizoryzae]